MYFNTVSKFLHLFILSISTQIICFITLFGPGAPSARLSMLHYLDLFSVNRPHLVNLTIGDKSYLELIKRWNGLLVMEQVLGVNLKDAAWFSAVPWAMMAAVGFIAGASSDFLVQSGVSLTTTRKLMQSIGFLGPAAALLGLNAVRDPMVAAAWLTAAVGLSSFSQAGFLVNYQEIGPKYAGVLHGIKSFLPLSSQM